MARSRAADGLGASEEVQSLVRLELEMVKKNQKNQRSSVRGFGTNAGSKRAVRNSFKVLTNVKRGGLKVVAFDRPPFSYSR